MTQTDLASAAGVSYTLISLAETGGRNLGYDNLDRIAGILEATPTEREQLEQARKAYRGESPDARLTALEERLDRLEGRIDSLLDGQ